jgi:hypothetical protein
MTAVKAIYFQALGESLCVDLFRNRNLCLIVSMDCGRKCALRAGDFEKRRK